MDADSKPQVRSNSLMKAFHGNTVVQLKRTDH